MNKNCFACNVSPPSISASSIKALGEKFYMIDPSKLFDDSLLIKSNDQKAAGERTMSMMTTSSKKDKGKKNKEYEADEDDYETSKKSKK